MALMVCPQKTLTHERALKEHVDASIFNGKKLGVEIIHSDRVTETPTPTLLLTLGF
jgi:hypothetical protein